MTKYIKDPIYPEYLIFSKLELKLMDTISFKRLHNIKQLGSLYEVFPSATHTRFLHSLGVSNLAENYLNKLFDNSDIIKTRKDVKDIQNIKMAGLYHDIGHGPFSHVFDHYVLEKLCPNNPFKDHEIRSCHILERTCNKVFNSNELTGYDVEDIKNYINPVKHINHFKNQIICNKINSIDVDKLDYLKRDPYFIGSLNSFDYTRLTNKMKIYNNSIYYHEDVADDLFDMYYTRYKLHREIYNHKAVKSIELMISDILLDCNREYNFPSIIGTDDFLSIDDTILTQIKYNKEPLLNKSKKIIKRIENRDIYKQIYKSNTETLEEVRDNILDKYKDNKDDDYHFIELNFNLCNGMDTPFKNIKFYNYNNYYLDTSSIYTRKLIPNHFNEKVINVYKK